ncbi:hypothetical protein IPG36_07810 [bacterium]|nr:MAG: hypothetical protein IPG36_07810 [bacterium]
MVVKTGFDKRTARVTVKTDLIGTPVELFVTWYDRPNQQNQLTSHADARAKYFGRSTKLGEQLADFLVGEVSRQALQLANFSLSLSDLLLLFTSALR